MKTLLPFCLLLISAFALHAQNVLTKKSINYPGDTTAYIYTYNTNCLVSSETTYRAQTLFTYYANKLRYQSTYMSYNQDSGKYIKNGLATFFYNDAGEIVVYTYEYYDAATDMYRKFNRDTIIYEGNNFVVKDISQTYNPSSNTWENYIETDTYNNSKKTVDSIIATYFNLPFYKKRYYTYYTNSEKQYELITYNYTFGILDKFRETYYRDSANYTVKDSTVNEYLNDSVYVITGISRNTFFYNKDNELTEQNNINQTGNFSTHYEIYYTYGPCSSVLPVTLLNFSAERQNNNALLHWQTVNETNTSSFNIQRSIDGQHFTAIGSIAASGNSSLNKSYTYTDANAFLLTAPKLYYRLAETDQNGVITFNKTVTLDITAGKLSVYILPNPVVNRINVYATAAVNSAQITVTDMKGRIVYNASQIIGAGSRISIDASGFAKGIYIVTIRSAASQQQLKIVKE